MNDIGSIIAASAIPIFIIGSLIWLLFKVKKQLQKLQSIEASIRTIPMSPLVASTLFDWKTRCAKGDLNLAFPNGAGNVEGHANIFHRIFKPLMISCEIVDSEGEPKFGFHSLRHAAASLFVEQGWTPKKIQVLLGHSSIDMTFDVYGHLFHNPEEDITQMAKMESDVLAA